MGHFYQDVLISRNGLATSSNLQLSDLTVKIIVLIATSNPLKAYKTDNMNLREEIRSSPSHPQIVKFYNVLNCKIINYQDE